jgi:oligopeptide/dipeptide ABC transporter ATP-binding protein
VSDVSEPILRLDGLSVSFWTEEGTVTPVSEVDFALYPGEILGVVGESGCGKTVTSKAILRLLPEPHGWISAGHIHFGGRDLAKAGERQMRALRGRDISMIFQDPMTALNPVLTVGYQVDEVLRTHTDLSKRDRKDRVVEMLGKVGIPSPRQRFDEYPHQLSGGMRQRVVIAMAMILDPAVLIADEPTTALDVTMQAQILDLIAELASHGRSAVIFITHDLGVVAEVCDRVVVMYAGRVVEEADCRELFRSPRHPYTSRLLESIPKAGNRERRSRLLTIDGIVPNLLELPPGCRFADRCHRAEARCRGDEPALLRPPGSPDGHRARCFFPEEAR